MGEAADIELVEGTPLGRFVVVRHLGSGGMGTVVEARDPELGRSVALKVLRSDRQGDDLSLRLVREAQALAQHARSIVHRDFKARELGAARDLFARVGVAAERDLAEVDRLLRR